MIGSKKQFKEQSYWWGTPIGPSWPNRQTYNLLPWVVGPDTPVNQNQRCGRGMIVTVNTTVASNTPYVVTHNLGRIPTALIMVSAGYDYPPRIAFASSGVRNQVQCTVVFDTPFTRPRFWVL